MMNTLFLLSLLLVVMAYSADGYFMQATATKRRSLITVKLSDSPEEVDQSPAFVSPDAEDADRKIFDMNKRVRLGRSRDQDGKSNIWSIEPTMEVVEETESGLKKNLLIGGLVIGTAVAVLPLFSLLSKLLPDPADF